MITALLTIMLTPLALLVGIFIIIWVLWSLAKAGVKKMLGISKPNP